MDALEVFRRTNALLEGHFVLRSGLHSRQFFQCAKVLQHPQIASELIGQLADRLREDEVAYDRIISPAMGGILVGQDLARHLGCEHIFAEKQDGKLVLRRFEIEPGARYLVAEDVVTTGSAVRETMKIVTDGGGAVAAVAVIVDRSGNDPVDFGCPLYSLLRLSVETFPPDQLPADLAALPATKPGSK
ncbi:MAG: orotate phosphoribosyltransferase [Verrucomicrobiota bacterium]